MMEARENGVYGDGSAVASRTRTLHTCSGQTDRPNDRIETEETTVGTGSVLELGPTSTGLCWS